jgi:polyhydroxyalkanoate synthase subunit PhaE
MSETTKQNGETWGETWAANQQALFKSMFTFPAGEANKTADPQSPASQPLPNQMFSDLQETWKESIEKWTQFVKDGASPKAISAQSLAEMFAPAKWSSQGSGAFDAALRQVLEGPKFTGMADADRNLLELQRRALERDKDVTAYQMLVQQAWQNALARFSQSLASAKEVPGTWRELTDRWLSVANATLIDAHRTDEFLQAQNRMLRSASEYRLQERKMAEAWCEACHIPTRTEVDELQRTVTELKRELRLQRRRGEAVTPGPAVAAAPRKSSRSPAAKKVRSSKS